MRRLLSMRSWITNLLLVGAAAVFGYQTHAVWSADNGLEVDKLVQKPPTRHVDRRIASRHPSRYSAFEVIPRKDLFASDRREKLPEKSPTPARVIPAKPLDKRFVLFGIVINGRQKAALVSNLAKKSATEKASVWVKAGDKIGTLSVSEIQSEQIILNQGGHRHTVRLSHQNHFQKRPVTRKKIKRSETDAILVTQPKVKNTAAKRSQKSS